MNRLRVSRSFMLTLAVMTLSSPSTGLKLSAFIMAWGAAVPRL